ncbi:amino acid/amide ABC transporter substrate-binding protein, HAAT family [Thermomonospora echinospora]|uniref:Amino acid/amide ABC transporter substrate-binding protein, HAAT family n=1 Tax=Thermomonospora echinospora TaxID=1992 RepID=A0A1H6BMX1_9ACTN|nr:ABC transporter substrate-binding protein [Thermomonospora echinospora]SEG62020.1 amino acid/amide ABC transporter substrate-binding protein, HAAT family [Thermomonospora echinospora]
MRRFVPFLAAAALALAGCGGSGGSGDSGDGAIKIGFIESLTGNYAPLGGEAKKTVDLAVEQINAAGGIKGRRIELITLDDRTAPDQGVLHFNRLRTEKVTAIIGSTFSNVGLAVEPLAEREKIPYISLAPADEQVDPIRRYTFVVPAISSTYAEAMLQYWQAHKITRVAVAYDTKSAYSKAGFAGMKRLAPKYGVQIVREEPYETTASDFSPIFTHVRGSDAQAMMAWASGAPGVTLAKQYPNSGLRLPLYMTGSQASKLWLEPVGPAAEGVYVQSAIGVVGEYLPDGKLKSAIKEMADPFRQKYGYDAPQFAQDGYSGVRLLAAAIEKAGTDRERIRDALETMTLVTPAGKYTYSATDHSGLRATDISMNQVKDGRLVPTDWSKRRLAETARAVG